MRKRLVNVASSFLACVLTAYVLSCIAQSIFVLTSLASAGAEITFGIALQTILHDLYGLAFSGAFFPFVLTVVAGFSVAVPVAALLVRYLGLAGSLVYPLAGAVAMATVLYLIQINFFYNMTFLAGTRGGLAYSIQLMAGALGGFVFAFCLTKQHDNV